MAVIQLVRNDSRPKVTIALRDKNNNNAPLNLVGATVSMLFREKGATTLKATVAGTLLPGKLLDDGTIDADSPYDVAGYGGRVEFAWGATDLDTAGNFEAEFQVTFADSGKATTYQKQSFKIREDFDDA